jgi:hypothetical protein
MPKTIPPGRRPTAAPELHDRLVDAPVNRACSIQGLPNRAPEVYSHFYCRLLGKAGSMLANGVRRHTVALVGVCALGLIASACGGDGPADPVPTSSPSPSTVDGSSATPTPSLPTSDPDAWRSDFTSAQLDAYDAALARWDAYEARSEPIWAAGRATPAAESLFKEFFPSPIWNDQLEQLRIYERYQVRIAGTPTVLWSRARSIGRAGSAVEIVQCVDYASTTTTQNGDPTEPIRSRKTPVAREISLSRPKGFDWLIYGINATPGNGGKKDRPCDPAA